MSSGNQAAISNLLSQSLQTVQQQILTNTNDINKNNNDIIDDINYFYNITDDDLLILLNELPKSYVNKWNEWLSITFILKKIY